MDDSCNACADIKAGCLSGAQLLQGRSLWLSGAA